MIELVELSLHVSDEGAFCEWADAALHMACDGDSTTNARKDALCVSAVRDALVALTPLASRSVDGAAKWFEIISQLL